MDWSPAKILELERLLRPLKSWIYSNLNYLHLYKLVLLFLIVLHSIKTTTIQVAAQVDQSAVSKFFGNESFAVPFPADVSLPFSFQSKMYQLRHKIMVDILK